MAFKPGSGRMVLKLGYGKLIAEKSLDPDYPGFYISYHPKGIKYEYTIALIEALTEKNHTSPDLNEGSIHVRIWGEPTTQEEYTEHVEIPFSVFKEEAQEDG